VSAGRIAIALGALLVALGPAATVRAESSEASVTGFVDADQIGEGDSVNFTVEVQGDKLGRVEDPDLSGLADFTIASGPSVGTSTSMVWRGGQASSSTKKQFRYVLLPRRRGTLTIPSVSIRVGNRIRQTDPITVEVVEGKTRTARPGAPRSPRGLFGQQREPEPAGEILVESTLDRTSAYIGEQLLLTYKVYTQMELVEVPSPTQLPSYTGFWVEEIPTDPRDNIRRVRRGGKEFVEITLMKKALFPTTSGTLTIEPTAFGLPVRAQAKDPFDSIFFTPTKMIYRQTQPLEVRIKPLPEKGRPASFTGAVGTYTLKAETDSGETRVSDALSLKITVAGRGNIRVVGEPVLPPLPDYKIYEPRVEDRKRIVDDRLTGTRTWDYVLTPLAPGKQDIPEIRFSYFDPEQGSYVEASTREIPVKVDRAEGSEIASMTPGAGSRREVTAIGQDIRYIKPGSQLSRRGRPYHESAAFVTLLLTPLVINAGLFAMVRRREHLSSNAVLVRQKRAPAFARRRLRQAQALLDAGRSIDFHAEVGRAVTGYLADKLNHSASGLTHQMIDRGLEEKGVGADLRHRVLACLEGCDYAQFAPVASGRTEMLQLMRRAEQVIVEVEGSIPGRAGRRRS